jgi:GNAT superfamily N-acetyltransferase
MKRTPITTVIEADLNRTEHQRAIVDLIDAYARDPMGDGKPLAADVRRSLIPGLRQHPTTIVFLAYQRDDPVGIAVCFRGFSTFAARPLVNIHDLAVLPDCRGLGVGRLLLETIGRKARDIGCCKLTLEVQENNRKARRVYASAGFAQAVYEEAAGGALFLSKMLQ